jgi:acetyl esterase/lipase
MPLDPAAQAVLDMLAEVGGPPLEEMDPVEARAVFANLAALGGEGADVASAEEREIAGVNALVVTPHGTGPFPVLVWIHGGGWVIGRAGEAAATAKDLAAGANCIVVSVDYRLAPENKCPAAVDDCFAVTRWVLDNAAEIGGDPARVAVGGDSAGGNLSALAAIEFGDRLRYQALVYPATDLTMSYPSVDENADGYLLTKASMEWFVGHYLDDSGMKSDDAKVSPLFASDEALGKAPPALVITAEFDPLRDEGEAYAERLRASGVDVTHKRFDGQIHAFYSMPVAIPAGAEAIAMTTDLLQKAFA